MVEGTKTVLLVDDHPLLRKGVSQLLDLEDGLEVVGEASSGNKAVTMALELDPDLILLDLSMRGMDGIETLSVMRDAGISAHIVVFTVSDDRSDVISALKAGADGYLLKDVEPEMLVQSIQQACSGKLVLSDQLTEVLASSFRKDRKQRDISQLTRRERQILKHIAEGLSNKLIARRLDIADSTVKVHVKHLLKKLGFRSRVEAAVWMVDQRK